MSRFDDLVRGGAFDGFKTARAQGGPDAWSVMIPPSGAAPRGGVLAAEAAERPEREAALEAFTDALEAWRQADAIDEDDELDPAFRDYMRLSWTIVALECELTFEETRAQPDEARASDILADLAATRREREDAHRRWNARLGVA